MNRLMQTGVFSACLAVALLTSSLPAQRAESDKEKPKENTVKTEPLSEEAELAKGKEIYDLRCKSCHRADGTGTLEEMDLTDNIWKHGGTPEDIERVIREGIKDTGMRAILGDYTDSEIKALVKFVLKFSANAPHAEPAKPGDPVKTPEPK